VNDVFVSCVCVCCRAGFLVDYCGRKETIVINDCIFLLGTIMLSAAHSYIVLVRQVISNSQYIAYLRRRRDSTVELSSRRHRALCIEFATIAHDDCRRI